MAARGSPAVRTTGHQGRHGHAAGGSSFLSIRTKHIEALERMLNFNNQVDSKTSWQENWKLLIYDAFCRDIISTLFKVADLRKHGVTLHLNLNADRQQVQDVSAIYMCTPSRENVDRIGKDCAAGLYDSMHLNWSSSITQEQLLALATAVAESDSAQRVAKVFDQHFHFISLDHRLFSLQMPDSYIRLNDPEVGDAEMESTMNDIVSGLFSALVTLGVVPVIRCPRGDAAGMVGERLNKRLKDHLLSTNNLFRDQAYASGSYSRPVLIIMDRSQDLSVNLQHAWTYEAMLHDVLGMKLNKITVTESEGQDGGKRSAPRVYDLGANDTFWVDNCGQPFPKVTDEIEERLTQWKQEYAQIGAQGAQDAIDDLQGGGGLDALTRAAQLVPELTERKRLLDQHTSICTVLLEKIKERELDNFFSLESAIVSGSVYNAKSALMQVFSPEALGSAEDKLRLFVIYYLCNPSISDADCQEYTQALEKLGADLKLVNYLQYLRKMHSLTSRALALGTSGKQGGGGMSLTDIMSKVQEGTQTATSVLKSVTASMGGKRELPVTRLVDMLMDNKPSQEADNYRYFDPNLHDDSGNRPREQRKSFKEAILFMVGSGNYVEYQDLMDYSKRSATPRNIIYGTTELVSAQEFLRQLTVLGGKRFMSI